MFDEVPTTGRYDYVTPVAFPLPRREECKRMLGMLDCTVTYNSLM